MNPDKYFEERNKWLQSEEATMEDKLRKLPAFIAYQESFCVEARTRFQEAQQQSEVVLAQSFLAATGTAEERKAVAKTDPAYSMAKNLEFSAEAQWKKMQLRMTYFDNAFTALRKLASLRETEMKSSIHQ